MTQVVAVMARPYVPDMFEDLGLWPSWSCDEVTGLTTLTFPGTLSAPTIATIRARMTSRNDDDMAARASLAALRDNPTTPACCREVINYLLGDA